ncbi:MAG TPA: GNAT family N-acetyltransferase [Pirellulales bacterium]|jgi:ribosomal protein S18 acetylase RimI-like enzyme|nr:GNAT family N-acetyltransferase [Pirellulales bacterium]
MDIDVRPLEPSRFDEANRVIQAAFERTTSFRAMLELQSVVEPDGLLSAVCQDHIVGTVGYVDYGSLAYIGLMTVAPHYQRRGIGRRLMNEVLDALDRRGCPLVLLDATAKGALVYRHLGFVEDAQAVVFDRPQRPGEFAPTPNVRTAEPHELTEIIEFDAPIFGARRRKLLEALWPVWHDRCMVARNARGELAGYLFARESVWGPWIATSPSAAEGLLATGLALFGGEAPQVLVPRSNRLCAQVLARFGFREERRLSHMRRGGDGPPGQAVHIYGQSSFAHG